MLVAVWAGDTLAYVGGRLVGRHKMAPRTSPGKTWEGFVFGTAATIFVTFVALYKQHFLTIRSRSCSVSCWRSPRRSATSSSRS